MAQLPPDGKWLIQNVGDLVVLTNRDTQEEAVRFDPADPDSFGPAQQVIHEHPDLTDEAKSMAHFWSGYFYAYAVGL